MPIVDRLHETSRATVQSHGHLCNGTERGRCGFRAVPYAFKVVLESLPEPSITVGAAVDGCSRQHIMLVGLEPR